MRRLSTLRANWSTYHSLLRRANCSLALSQANRGYKRQEKENLQFQGTCRPVASQSLIDGSLRSLWSRSPSGLSHLSSKCTYLPELSLLLRWWKCLCQEMPSLWESLLCFPKMAPSLSLDGSVNRLWSSKRFWKGNSWESLLALSKKKLYYLTRPLLAEARCLSDACKPFLKCYKNQTAHTRFHLQKN